MAGRRPKPNYLHVVNGTGRKDRHSLDEAPQPRRAIPSAPEHLSEDARAAWDKLSHIIDRMGVLTEADAFALERAAECYAELRRGQRVLESVGWETARTSETRDGGIMHRAHPVVAQMADADRRLKSWLVEFGMTPAARTKVRTADTTAADPLDKFLPSGGAA